MSMEEFTLEIKEAGEEAAHRRKQMEFQQQRGKKRGKR